MTKTTHCAAAFCMILLFGCNKNNTVTSDGSRVDGVGDLVAITVDVPVFHSISDIAMTDITVTKGSPQRVVLRAQQNILDILRHEVVDGTLRLSFPDNVSVHTTKSIEAEITVPELRSIEDIGAADVTLSGDAQGNLNVSIIGVGNVAAYGLEVDTCSVSITGTGNVFVRVNQLLNVIITGTGNVFFRGSPTIASSITGTGRIIDDN
ncbi:MAG: DUF2807 domain-containing protein [Bacteroidetes bacterium]|nr:DUF2807 domain-containing protein [Bacteroidota bacterium]